MNQKQTDADLNALAKLHEAIVAEGQLAETAELHDTDAHEDLLEAEACLRILERVRRQESGELTDDHIASDTRETIGRFRIVGTLGEGSYGIVYLAHDPDLNRKVAIKVPRPEVSLSPRLRDRFLREAEVAASLRHPAIVRVHQAGRTDGTLFISSEYCGGWSLAEWLRQHDAPMPATDAARLLCVLADAVQHAHSRGVLHRDLKPANVLLSGTDDATGEGLPSAQLHTAAQITDFGLARFIDAPIRETQAGAVVGTPAYMAPEQADGRLDDVSSASDVYSLGVILYELLTRSVPFQEDGVLATLEAVRLKPPLSPSRRNGDVPRDLEAICLKCLEKDAANRYATAAELATDLKRFLDNQPVNARHLGSLGRAWRWSCRNPALAAVSGVAVLSLVAGVTAVVWQWQRAEAFAIQADRDRGRTRDALDAMTSEAALDAMTSQNKLTPEQRGFLNSVVATYRELADERPQSLDGLKRVADAHRRVGMIYWRLGEFEASEASLQEAIVVADRLNQSHPMAAHRWQLMETLRALGAMQIDCGLWDDAEKNAQRHLALAEQAVRDDPTSAQYLRSKATALGTIANANRRQKRFQESHDRRVQEIEAWSQAIEKEPNVAKNRAGLSAAHNNLANVLVNLQRMPEASQSLERSLQLKTELARDFPENVQYRFDLAIGTEQLALVRDRMGHTDEVAEQMREAITVYQELTRDYPLDVRFASKCVTAQLNLAVILNRLKHADAVQVAREAVEVSERLVARSDGALNHSALLANAYLTMGHVFRDQSRFEEARRSYTAAIETVALALQRSPGNGRLQDIQMNAHWGRATCASHSKSFDAALADWDEAIRITPPGLKQQLRLARATTQVQMGEVEAALVAARACIGADQTDGPTLYNAACVFALASEQVEDEEQSEAHASNAVSLLTRSIALGFDRSSIQADPELRSLHARSDFQRLLNPDRH